MLLSSYDRLIIYTGREDDLESKRRLVSILAAISSRIEDYLNRDLEITSRTEYFDLEPGTVEIFPRATPIASVTSVYADVLGDFTGGEYPLTDYFIGSKYNSIVLRNPVEGIRRALRVIYTGGEAYDPVISTFTVSGGAFTAGKYVIGNTSRAVGKVVASASTPLQVASLYGIFRAGETIVEYTDEGATIPTSVSGTLLAITVASLAQIKPILVQACEVECRYWDRHKFDFVAQTVTRDSLTKRSLPEMGGYVLQPETESLLEPYRRLIL